MKKAKIFLIALCALLTATLSAQNISVTGSVKDAATGEGIPFASVIVKGTTNGVSTDAQGAYSIQVSANAVLEFSSVGYSTKEVTVGNQKVINVDLNPDSEFLESTIVIGYGSAKKVSSLVGSVQTVTSETVKNAPAATPLDLLQGQVAGLSVLTSNGQVGDNSTSMTLHGVGSLGTSSAPLYVIDGIPSSSRTIMAMNPNDIESISILKDASATSIYGSRAANGVIYVTTKVGSYNETASVNIRSQYGISTLANPYIYENMMSGDELKDFWIKTGIHSESWIDQTYTSKGYNANTKWYKYFTDVITPQYQNDITIQGGGKKVAYMISASQFHQEGFTIGNFFDRYTVRSNVQGHPTNWLKVGLNLNLSLDKNRQNTAWGSSTTDADNYTNGGLSMLLLPLYPAVDENGKVYEKKFLGLGARNPHWQQANSGTIYHRYGAVGNVFVQITPVKNLNITSRAGADGYIRLGQGETKPSYAQENGGSGSESKASTLSYDATITNTIEYVLDINHNHKLTFLAGQEGVLSYLNGFSASASKHPDDYSTLLQQGEQSTFSMTESDSKSKFLSYFGHIDYTLFDKYYFDVVIRNDASSRFGSAVRNATFWSAGAKWNIKKESFLQDVGAINALDFKASYGTQGNAAIGNYSSLGLIGSSGKYQEATGFAVTQPANNKLTWENQALFTAGLSGKVFNVLDFELEYYIRKTSSMLMDVPNPYTTGFDETTQNVGSLQNSGVDITLGVDILRYKDAFLRFNTTFNYNAQKITSLFDGRERWEIANTGVAYVVGKPIMFYYPIYAGVDPETGNMLWYKAGENKDVTTMKETTDKFDDTSLEQNTGKTRYAPINGGFSFSGGYKGFSFQADFTYVLGKYLINNTAFFYANPNQFNTMNTHKSVSDYWTPDNKNAKFPDWSKGAVMEFDTHLLEDASFLRLKNLQIAYSLPKSALAWTNNTIKNFKITITGRNLLTATKFTGMDPEVNSNLVIGMTGNTRQILGGIEITF